MNNPFQRTPYAVTIMAIPLSEDPASAMTLECSLCGPVGTSEREDAEVDSFEHLRSHGATPIGEVGVEP